MFKVNECGFFASPHISNPFRLCIYKSKTQEPFEIDARRGGERVSKGRRSVQKVGQSGRGEDIGWGMPVFDTVVESRIFADRNPHFQDSITNLDVGQWTVANSIDLTSRRKNTCFSVKQCKRCVFSFRSLNLRESSLRGILVVFFFDSLFFGDWKLSDFPFLIFSLTVGRILFYASWNWKFLRIFFKKISR